MDGDEVGQDVDIRYRGRLASLVESRLLNFGVDLLFSFGVNPSHCRRFSWGRAPVDWEHAGVRPRRPRCGAVVATRGNACTACISVHGAAHGNGALERLPRRA
uniref:Uncharacterized protein n=1 Tax=Oryza glumipatula TaxID=40148 RepID=A0A0D9Y8T7_9ORYZ